MGILIALLIVGIVVLTIMYLMQFYFELDGRSELRIKDGLMKELIDKAINDPDSFLIDQGAGTITMGRIKIYSKFSDLFWFPYKVEKLPKDYRERNTDDDWGGTVGYITRFSKDYQHIKALLKKDKTSIEQSQRQKLNINK
jgi:hypothetical protein